ncbi:cinnamoyl-CoA reductase [Senna tora]|uniref:Cinnamoyl-CoA reductase n=1 Tax=Senna tora TaxID=362788 RepID=A0A834WWQ4_9FABA|nr:cinnamoyl-CoA reductase [Senna tora]
MHIFKHLRFLLLMEDIVWLSQCEDDNSFVPKYQVSNVKAKTLGIEFVPLKRSKNERMSSSEGKVVCVTGGSGYIASWLVKLLLHRGYTVKATVRDPSDPKKVEHLLKLDGAKERLHLIKANLLEEGSFDSVVEGCEGVFHTASPFYYNVTDPQAELIDPAVNGTLNVLKSCAKSSSVKRVVLTSSFYTVPMNGRPKTPEVVVDETWFSSPDFCRESKMWYPLSKTLAEEAAWKFAKENNIDLITRLFLSLLEAGAQTFPNSTLVWINVKDVANAHIQAFEIASASGRYCLVESVVYFSDVVKILRELYPTVQLPEKCENDRPLMPKFQISKEKAKTLGVEFVPLESSSSGKVVCVTGASGYIASWIVKFLLLRGYTVKATVRDPSDPKKVEHLLKLDGAEERLHLVKANLTEEGSFDSVVEGCEGVFHTASPFYTNVKDPQAELIDPAVKGTLNVLKSCAKSPSVKRVVLTSSIAAVAYNGKPKTPEVVVDETWFSTPDFCTESKVYGAQTFPNLSAGWINVKDVANAHIHAFEISSATGRYCLVERVVHYSEIVKILNELYPTLQLPKECENDKPLMPKYQVSKEKAKSLGIEFISFEASLRETVESLTENKLVNF